MLEIKDIEHLAKLARIELSEDEKKSLLKEVDPILGYVSQIKEVAATGSEEKKAAEHRNITRADTHAYAHGRNTKEIVEDFPEQKDNYLKVKKIL
jgi:aspartyl-tRNA(Asn)/glutamyl-tRNA(Gln) amidotransferase subunit C